MSDLKARWDVNPLFQFLRIYLLDPNVQPVGMSRRDWYLAVAPKIPHPTIDDQTLDCRGLNLEALSIGDIWLNDVLDFGSFVRCIFEKTHFQSTSAQHCDLSSSQFVSAQMSPFYAKGSNFSNCVFKSCFAQGQMPRYYKDVHGTPRKGTYSDFRDCDFSNVRAQKTGFDRCDFRNADFTGAQFERCIFSESDLQGVLASNTQFIDCDLQGALIDDTPTWRSMLSVHTNLNTEKIVWTPI